MKTLKLLLLISCMLIIAGCKSGTPSTISGIYVTSFKQEFSMGNDTLIIEAYHLSSGTYQVERKSGYHRIRNGQLMPKEYNQRKWMATFDQDRFILQETAYGKQIYFKPDLKSLSFGWTYHKIN
ncbi:MAG: hypothetical protein JWR38_2822 [Mucilaginibacter sp.]|nr:hypothetical protein [Mucilaginibacter sp.]